MEAAQPVSQDADELLTRVSGTKNLIEGACLASPRLGADRHDGRARRRFDIIEQGPQGAVTRGLPPGLRAHATWPSGVVA